MNYTTHLNLNKPEKAEQFNIDHWNQNSDTIDTAIYDEQVRATGAEQDLQSQINQNRNVNRLIGTLQISQGGTGQTTSQDSLNALHGSVATQNSINADDEITFIKRTPADVNLGTPETIDVKDVKLSNLASDAFELNRASNNSLFSSSKHGLVPKGTSNDSKKFLSETGQWLVPAGDIERFEVTASRQIDIVTDSIIEITAQSAIQVIVVSPSDVGTKLTVINNSQYSQTLYGDFNGNSRVVAPDSFVNFIWLGNIWKIDSNAGGNGVAFVGTRAQYEQAKLIGEGADGYIPSNSLVIITDENDTLMGDEQ